MILAALHGDETIYANLGNIAAEDDDNVMDDTTTSTIMNKIMSTVMTTVANNEIGVSTTTLGPDHDSAVSMDNFYPALVQCFGIIICG